MTTLGTASAARTPSGLRVAPASYEKIEEVAEGLFPLLPNVRGSRFTIDAWRVLEQTLPRAGFKHHIADVSELNECAAFTIPDESLVVLREDVYDGLFSGHVFSRSTVVHELAHIVLKHAVTLHRGAVLGKHKFFEDSEWQAKALTAAVTMPLEACRLARSAEDLADMCGTSRVTARYRLEKLAERGVIGAKLAGGDLFPL